MRVQKRIYLPRCWILILVCLVAGLFLAGCYTEANPARTGQEERVFLPGGDPTLGQEAIVEYGCHTCHTIPGIPGANATVGPPLTDWADRQYIAGNLANTPDNLLRWIMDPQEIEPGTAMPDMGVTEEAARHIGAYLYTLERANAAR